MKGAQDILNTNIDFKDSGLSERAAVDAAAFAVSVAQFGVKSAHRAVAHHYDLCSADGSRALMKLGCLYLVILVCRQWAINVQRFRYKTPVFHLCAFTVFDSDFNSQKMLH